jgi:hypothetical protein
MATWNGKQGAKQTGTAWLVAIAALGSTAAAGCAPAAEEDPRVAGADLTFQLAREVAAGTEVHVCREFAMPSGAAVSVARFESQVPGGMHHLLAYRVPGKTAAQVTDEVFDCGDVPGPIVFTQTADDAGARWPAGVGVQFAPGEVIRVELHYLNVGSAARTVAATLGGYFPSAPLTSQAGSFFMYDRDIAVPAHGTFTAKMHCEIPADIHILDILPHVHVHGSAERVWLSGGNLKEPKLLLSTKGYGDQEARHFDAAPIAVAKGQALDFECDYQNTTDENVIEGPSKEHHEMCMVLGDYYPRMSTPGEWCTLPDSGPVHAGDKTCGQAFGALQTGKNGDYQSELIITQVCAQSSKAWNNVGNCAFNHCSHLCPGPKCGECASKACLAELAACQNATCG